MKKLEVAHVQEIGISTPIKEVSEFLDKLDKHRIEQLPWPEFSYKPKAAFALVHNNDCLFLKFYVQEETARALYHNTHDPVYKDSCVEMFLSFNEEMEYYNFEFNLIGVCLSGYGGGRENRQLLPKTIIEEIKSFSEVRNKHKDQADIQWQLTLIIPVNVFYLHSISGLSGIKAKGNFFKCGDDLPKPHFLSWNPIKTEKPNFHLPEFFGELWFA